VLEGGSTFMKELGRVPRIKRNPVASLACILVGHSTNVSLGAVIVL
jgi:hypothetical protein